MITNNGVMQIYYLTVLYIRSPVWVFPGHNLEAGRAVSLSVSSRGESVYWLTQLLADFSSKCCRTEVSVSWLLEASLCVDSHLRAATSEALALAPAGEGSLLLGFMRLIGLDPPGWSQNHFPSSGSLTLITSANSFLPNNVRYLQFPGMRMRASLGGHSSAYHVIDLIIC